MKYPYPSEDQIMRLSEMLPDDVSVARVMELLFPYRKPRAVHQWKHDYEAVGVSDRKVCQLCGLTVHRFKVPDRNKYDTMWTWPDGSTLQQSKPYPTPLCRWES